MIEDESRHKAWSIITLNRFVFIWDKRAKEAWFVEQENDKRYYQAFLKMDHIFKKIGIIHYTSLVNSIIDQGLPLICCCSSQIGKDYSMVFAWVAGVPDDLHFYLQRPENCTRPENGPKIDPHSDNCIWRVDSWHDLVGQRWRSCHGFENYKKLSFYTVFSVLV